MKTTIIILMVAGGLTMQAVAASPDNSPSASTHFRQNVKHPFYEFWMPKTAPSYKIEHFGRISSRPWAQIAGRPAPAPFADQRAIEPTANYYRGGTSPD